MGTIYTQPSPEQTPLAKRSDTSDTSSYCGYAYVVVESRQAVYDRKLVCWRGSMNYVINIWSWNYLNSAFYYQLSTRELRTVQAVVQARQAVSCSQSMK